MNQDMNALIHRRRKGNLRVVADERGKGKLAPIETEPAGDVAETSPRVVDGTADGGKGREEPPQPTGMSRLIREQLYVASVRSARQGD